MNNKYLIIIPAFNEEANILHLLADIKKCGDSYIPLVIDDGSSDQTYELARKEARTLRHPVNLGIGATIQTGLLYAKNNNFDFCLQVDGDGQHPPEEIIKLINKQIETKANLVIGSRFIDNQGYRSTSSRRLGISILKITLNSFSITKISDPTSGFRLFDRKAIELFSEFYPYDYPEPISISYGISRGLTVNEVSVLMRARMGGKSSIYGIGNLKYMIKTTMSILLMKILRP